MRIRFCFAGLLLAASAIAPAQTPQIVQAVRPTRQDVERRATYPSMLSAWQEVELVPRTSGEVVELAVDIGDRVKQSQTLLRLDNPELSADELMARADVAEASATLQQSRAEESAARADLEAGRSALRLGAAQTQRLETLQRAQSATAKETEEAQKYQIAAQANIDQATAKVDVARARIEVATARRDTARAKLARVQAQQSYLTIKAPFDGVVTGRAVDVGAVVSANGSAGKTHGMITVQDDSKMRMIVDVPEADAAWITSGTAADITIDALRGNAIHGRITRTASSVDADVKTLRAQADLQNPDKRLMAGMYAHAALVLDIHKGVLAVPAKAVVTKGANSNVLVAADGKVKQVPVTIGYSNGTFTEIKSGLTGQEDVIVSSRETLGNGVPVQIDPQSAPKDGATSFSAPAPAGGAK